MYKYFAFISYKHRDKRFARKLQEKLEFYGLKSILNELKTKKLPADKTVIQMLEKKTREKSVYFSAQHSSDSFFSNALDFFKDKYRTKFSKNEQKFYPMCRDDGEFSSGNLNEIIENHLDDSKKLIFFCTEESLSDDENVSKYVKKELRYFYERNNGLKNIIFVNLGKNEPEKTKINTKLNRFLQQEFDLKIGDEQLTLWKKDKDCHLRIIASILGVDYSLIKSREKIRKRKKRTIVSIIAVVVLILFGWLWTGKIIDDNIEYALEKNEIAESIELLLDTNNIAKWTLHSNDKILDALNKVCEYDPGQLLRRVRFASDFYSNNSYDTIDENKKLRVFRNDSKNEDIVYDIESGEEKAKINYNEGILTDRNGSVVIREAEYFTLGDKQVYTNGKKTKRSFSGFVQQNNDDIYVISTNNFVGGTEKYHLVNSKTKVIKTIDIQQGWYICNVIESGIYYLDDNSLWFCSFDNGKEKVKENVRNCYIGKDSIYSIDAQGVFQGITNCDKIFGSPNNDNVYLTTKENVLYCFAGNTLTLKYQIPCNGNIFKFAENGFVLAGSGNSFESNVEYMLFNEKTGEVIKRINTWTLPIFDISVDGRNIVYSVNGKISVEETSTGKTTSIECERPVIASGFRYDGNVLWTVDTRGELCTWAIEPRVGIVEKFNEIIFDINDNNICWVSGGNNTYCYDLARNMLTKLLDRGVMFNGQSANSICVSINISESSIPLQRWLDKETGKILLENDEEVLIEQYQERDENMQKTLNDLKDKMFGTIDYSQISPDNNYIAVYGRYITDKDIEQCVFRVYDVKNGSLKYELQYKDEKRYPFEAINNKTITDFPVFHTNNNNFFVVYEDANDLKMKTLLCSVKEKQLLNYAGYPIYLKGMNKYWDKNVVFHEKNTNKLYTINEDEVSVINKAITVLSFINEIVNDDYNKIWRETISEELEYNQDSELYKPADINAEPQISLIYNDVDITNRNDVVEFGLGDIWMVNTIEPNGIEKTIYWYDENEKEAQIRPRINPCPIGSPDVKYKDGKEHILNIKVISALGREATYQKSFIMIE